MTPLKLLAKIPVFKKKIASFLIKEEGKISKEKIIKAGVAIAIISSMAGIAKAEAETCEESKVGSHDNDFPWYDIGGFIHTDNDSPSAGIVYHVNDCQGTVPNQPVDQESEDAHANQLILQGGRVTSVGTHNHCAGHNQHCSHASHASHSSHCSCTDWR